MRVNKSKQTNTIGDRLREVRINARLTQKEMGELINLTSGSVGAMENNLYTPNYDVLKVIKDKLGVPYAYIIEGSNDVDNSKLRQENDMLKKEVARLTKIVDKLLK